MRFMMSAVAYSFLRNMVTNRMRETPVMIQRPFLKEGFVPALNDCHLTAMQAALETFHPPVPGIAFMDWYGKLMPWPHIVNAAGNGALVDYSPPPRFRMLGFYRASWDEWPLWIEVRKAHQATPENIEKPQWDDPLLNSLHVEFYATLKVD